MDERQRYEQGMKTRREVLGDAHVDGSLKNRSEFNEAFQDLIMRYAWGEIWNRPGLPRQTRSMITLAMMVALNRGEEFRMHVRAAVRNARHARRDQRSALADRDLLWSASGKFGVPRSGGSFSGEIATRPTIRRAPTLRRAAFPSQESASGETRNCRPHRR